MKMGNQTNKAVRIKKIIVLCLCIVFININVFAEEVSSVMFENNFQDEGINMSLQGTGLKNIVLFKAFVAGFYKNDNSDEPLLGETPKRIEVEYFVNIPAQKLNKFTIDTMKDNVTDEEFNQILDEVELMGQYFVDLKPGDRFSLTYIPNVGTKFAHNNQLTGVIKGKDFAKALFSVWLGEKPFDKELKKNILGYRKNQEINKDKLAMRVER